MVTYQPVEDVNARTTLVGEYDVWKGDLVNFFLQASKIWLHTLYHHARRHCCLCPAWLHAEIIIGQARNDAGCG